MSAHHDASFGGLQTAAAADRGSAAVETALAAPLLLVGLLLVQLAWRVETTDRNVTVAATRAARAAAATQTPSRARTEAERVARAVLADRALTCTPLTVTVDTTRLRPGGNVTVHVQCTTDLADLTLLRVPATHDASATAVEPVDIYRGGHP